MPLHFSTTDSGLQQGTLLKIILMKHIDIIRFVDYFNLLNGIIHVYYDEEQMTFKGALNVTFRLH